MRPASPFQVTRTSFPSYLGPRSGAGEAGFDRLDGVPDAAIGSSPGAHLYHYAPYEKTALRRLASMHAVAEEAVDALLRENRMVDLYRVVREGVRVARRATRSRALSASTCLRDNGGGFRAATASSFMTAGGYGESSS